MPKKDATNARVEVRRPSDGERLDVKGSFWKPDGVVGDENERAETDLAAFSQSTAGNHDDGDQKNCKFTNKSLRHLPQGGRNCRGSKTDSRKGGRYGEARSQLW